MKTDHCERCEERAARTAAMVLFLMGFGLGAVITASAMILCGVCR